jgi:rhodanese-related sulfurtransferase
MEEPMFKQKSSKLFLALFLTLALVVAGCGVSNQATTVVDEVAPLAEEQAAPVQAATVEEPAEVVEAAPVSEFDVTAAVSDYLATIPEGYLAVGKIDAFKDMMNAGALVVDVREVAEYDEGHIPGSINIPLRTLAQNLDKLPTDRPIVTTCQSGFRASQAASALQMLGYDNTRSFTPSYKGWTEAEEPVSTDVVAVETYSVPEIAPELLAAVDIYLSNIPEGYLSVGTVEKLNEAVANGAVVIDVREATEYDEGHIPGAINIPLRTLGQNLDQIPTDAPVIIHCQSGHRAALATAALQTMGFTNVRAFPPGFAGWTSAGEPIAMAH